MIVESELQSEWILSIVDADVVYIGELKPTELGS